MDIFIFSFYVRFVVGCFFFIIFNIQLSTQVQLRKCCYWISFHVFFFFVFFLDRHKTAMRFRPRRESGRAQAGMSTFFFFSQQQSKFRQAENRTLIPHGKIRVTKRREAFRLDEKVRQIGRLNKD